MKKEGLIVVLGAAALIVGLLIYMRQSTPGVTLKSYSLNPQAEIQIANVFAKHDTDVLALQTGERISMAKIASDERTVGQALDTAKTINQSDNSRATAIAQTNASISAGQQTTNIVGDILGLAGKLILPFKLF